MPHLGGTFRDARTVAGQLGIPHHTLDLSGLFREQVMEPFVQAYEQGRTPNPCVTCNRTIKFGALLEVAGQLGCGRLATGHYARTERDTGSGRVLLKRAVHPEKDQSYVLWSLSQAQLERVCFPWAACPRRRSGPLRKSKGWSAPAGGTARTSASSRTGTTPRSSATTPAGPIPPDRSVTQRGGCWASTKASSTIQWASAGA